MNRSRRSSIGLVLFANSALPLVFLIAAGCSTVRHTTDLIKANQQGVEASTASIRLNQDAVSDSTDAINRNKKVILASTAAIAANSRAVQQSTDAIVQNQKVLADVTGMMEKLSPSGSQGKWVQVVVIAALVAIYAAVIALLISALRTGRTIRTIEAELHDVETQNARGSRFRRM